MNEMVLILIKLLNSIFEVYLEMSPFLLFGFFMAGLLSAFVSPAMVEKHLGQKGFASIVKASLFGVPLPLCSCGVIPVAASLKRSGATNGSTTSFLISTPQTGVDSILASLALLGPVYALFIPVAAFISGIIGGSIVEFVSKNEPVQRPQNIIKCQGDCCRENESPNLFRHIFHYGFVTIPSDIVKPLLLGLFIAGLISALIPKDFISLHLSSGFLQMLVMMAFGIPLYVCATASIPIASAMIMQGISPGAALVFLMTGPATNAASFTTLWKLMGRNAVIAYLFSIVSTALLAGFTLDYIFKVTAYPVTMKVGEMLPHYIHWITGSVLFFVCAYSLYLTKYKTLHSVDKDHDIVVIKLDGLECAHCANQIIASLNEIEGIINVTVDVATQTVTLYSENPDKKAIEDKLTNSGFIIKHFSIEKIHKHEH